MEKTYDPHAIEKARYQTWEAAEYFKPSGQGQPYSIVIPPPNVTGRLHMGHGFQYAIMDALVRYHRMCGDDTLWTVGTDHAGIATQMVVERQLQAEDKTRHDLGREAFIDRVWEWKATSGNVITEQMRRIGISVDWSRECFTMDDARSRAVQTQFIELYNDGLIYRGKRLVNWDPALHTAISDLEVISEEEQGHLWHIRYPFSDQSGHLVIATTRPETMLGDAAVAVHPEDDRYREFIGKTLQLPLCDREIPIIADDYVDPSFGTGCVKITPAHDFNDYAVGQRHDLPLITIFTPSAEINDQAPSAYQNLDRYEARTQIVKDLQKAGLIEKIQDHKLMVPRGDRSGVVIEPYLTDQWYMAMEDLAKAGMAVVRDEKVKFIPENWTKIYNQWLANIEDWCISRQLWWGHRIPAWYDEAGNIYVGEDELAIREAHDLDLDVVLTQDSDVLDTWFSAALWPFSTLGWPEQTPELARYYPTNVLVTGFDIIFFWVARMVMMGVKFMADVPFHEVYITGLIRDAEGQKMSKSKGNIIDPIDLIDGISLDDLVKKRTSNMMQPHLIEKIEKSTRKHFPEGIPSFGTDALRFTYCALASTGRDIRFDLGRIEGYRNFCNKLWNAARYVLMNCEGQDCGVKGGEIEYSLADRWIRATLQNMIATAQKHFANYRFDLLTQTLYEFTWNEYCGWYLELSKPILAGDQASQAEQRGTRQTLLYVLESLLRLLHPIMPFITEEIWLRVAPLLGKTEPTIMLQPYPVVDSEQTNKDAINDVEWLKAVITGIRNIRGEMNISPKTEIPVLFHQGNETDKRRLNDNETFLKTLAKLGELTWLNPGDDLPPSATALVGNMEVRVPLAGLIDKDAETQRLQKAIDKYQKDLTRAQTKLANPNFTQNAPEAVIKKEQAKITECQSAIEKLNTSLEAIQGVKSQFST